jgi:putative membrane-bound dehydrogenase-like protein
MKKRFETILLTLLAVHFTDSVFAQGFSPEEALKRMTVADGFEVKLVASEPLVRQPVTMTFDERGRMWVIQYLQYPNPAGLKAVAVDQYLRTKYDRVPEPPPKGPRGADRITILDDPDEHGRFRKAKDFVTGLNLASGMALGHGGVFVVQPPYLLFYPDKNGDDVPDGDPEVLLSGFGMEDAHAFANSLQWGPDGWLYGAQGSTVYANIRGIQFVQGIWRYHPLTKEFELFCEGGGNTWGVDFDRHGNLIAGTNFGNHAMLHQVQGAYYVKNFTKHGELKNPHAYGYFGHVPYKGFKGGHVTCGGVVYQGGAFPAKFHNQYIAANLLSNSIYWHILERRGSSFTARFGGDLLLANDSWFRPIDCLTGPDGMVYVADWYDKRATHLDPLDNWDRTNGRVYKIQPKGARPVPRVALAGSSSKELIGLLSHSNDWYRREARRLLAERRDASVLPQLRQMILGNKDALALEALWAHYVSGGLDDTVAEELLGHTNEDVRTWTIRLVGDAKKVAPKVQRRLLDVAQKDPSSTVRSQLACTARRLPGPECLSLVHNLMLRSGDATDTHIPLLLWWAVESKVASDPALVARLFDGPSIWRLPLAREHIMERLARRWMAERSDDGYKACARLLADAPGAAQIDILVRGMDKAIEGAPLDKLPAPFARFVHEVWGKRPDDALLLRCAVRLGSRTAYDWALRRATNTAVPEGERATLIVALGQLGRPENLPDLLKVFREAKSDALRKATLTALDGHSDRAIADTLLGQFPKLSPSMRGQVLTHLGSRPASALELLKAVDAGTISAKDVALDYVRRMTQYKSKEIRELIDRHWGKIRAETEGEKRARISYLNLILTREKNGDPKKGQLLFQKHCATCHTLFGEGVKLGPDLTGADRKDRMFLLMHTVDPSAVVRLEYAAYNIITKDGRTLMGLVAEATPQRVTLVDGKNERIVIPRSKIDEMAPSAVSLMPERILDALSDPEVRDLFGYLQSDGLKSKEKSE